MSENTETEPTNNLIEPADVAEETGSEVQTQDKPAANGEKPSTSEDFIVDDPFEAAPSEEKSETKEESPEAPKFDNDLEEWAEKAGHPKPTTENERLLLQRLRQSSRDFTKEQQAKKGVDGLKETIETVKKDAPEAKPNESLTPEQKDIAALKADRDAERTARLQSEFFSSKGISEDTGKLMGAIIKEKFDKASTPEAKQQALEYWSSPEQLSDLHELALARELNATGKDAIADEAAQKERERIAKETKASGVQRNAKATNTDSKTSEVDNLWLNLPRPK